MRTTNTVTAVVGIRGLLCLFTLTLAACIPDREYEARVSFQLKLLHTNDMHSNFEQFNYEGMPCKECQQCYGGFPRLKMAIDQELEKVEGRRNVGSLVLNAGNTFQGTMFYSFFRWRIVADLLPKLGIDVMCLGNNEFDNGVSGVNSFLESINIPVVVSNIDVSREPSLASRTIMTKSIIREVKGRKIGIIGYLTPDTAKLKTVGKVKIWDEVLSVREEAIRLKNNGIKIIIALGHSGFEMDQMIAQEVEEVDVVVGGHSHTFLYSGIPQDYDGRVDNAYPFCVIQPRTKKQVPVVQAFKGARYLGKLLVDFDDEGNVLSAYGNPILLDDSIEQDPELLKDIIKYKEELYVKAKEIIGQTSVVLQGYNYICKFRECNFGNFITDAYVDYNAENNNADFNSKYFWTDAPIAIQHSGGIWADIDSSSDSGYITYSQLMNTLPVINMMGKVELTGLEVKKILEKAVFMYDGETFCSEFLQISGLKIIIDLSKPSGERVTSILVRSASTGPEKYENISFNKTYNVILSDYIWEGGEGFEFDKKFKKFISIGATNFDIVSKQIEKNSPISPEVDGRISFLNLDQIFVNNSQPHPYQEPLRYRRMECGNYS